jgi:heme exporter protein D
MALNAYTLHWSTWSDFFAMGGYGFYVWGSFLACALLLLIESVQAQRAWLEELQSLGQAYELDEGLARLKDKNS